ncbi:hypothetical protein [Bdellovibrio sp. KM01]|uniref:hypothetical protein n=1 Tax=Bdellovibrio sp. KM01 TaxID=2748865 RepID=UPI0015EA511E|nr:hypothetical protein [Bdellovibrio sp. KM01]QLY26671.1 hypothetical protein HW988_06570 [Bdellovibrio sp. KM01]
MKLLIALALAFPMFAFAYGEKYQNRSQNPFVPEKGIVTAKQICVDEKNEKFRVFVPAHKQEFCKSYKWDHSDSHYPKKVCVGRTVKDIPAQTVSVSPFYQQLVCVKYDRKDSTRPTCVKSEVRTLQYPTSYIQYTYEAADWRQERPIRVQEKQIESCK